MIQVRRRAFETNSSSTHSIVVVTDDKSVKSIPDKFLFETGQFGWEFVNYHSPASKGSYFYTAVCELYGEKKSKEIMQEVCDYLHDKHGTIFFVKEPEFKKSVYDGKEYEYIDYESGYIDHSDETKSFVDAMLADKDLLSDFLFRFDSFVATGNDNSYEYERDQMQKPPENLEHMEFYKGN